MENLQFTVIEINEYEEYSTIRVQISSSNPDITCGDAFNVNVVPAIAALNAVNQPFVDHV